MSIARWVVYLTGLTIAILVAVYVARLFRDMALGVETEPIDHLSEFERMRDAGQLDEKEFKRLKSTLSDQNRESPDWKKVDFAPEATGMEQDADGLKKNTEDAKNLFGASDETESGSPGTAESKADTETPLTRRVPESGQDES